MRRIVQEPGRRLCAEGSSWGGGHKEQEPTRGRKQRKDRGAVGENESPGALTRTPESPPHLKKEGLCPKRLHTFPLASTFLSRDF